MAAEKWYKDGLRFDCTQCGKCCGGAPGYCWVSEDEIHALAERLGMEVEAFRRRYTRVIKKRGVSLQEKANYDCIFFDKKLAVRCTSIAPSSAALGRFGSQTCAIVTPGCLSHKVVRVWAREPCIHSQKSKLALLMMDWRDEK